MGRQPGLFKPMEHEEIAEKAGLPAEKVQAIDRGFAHELRGSATAGDL